MSKRKETKLSKYIKVPIKMMVKARDMYIKSMNQLSSHDVLGGGGMAFGIPVCNINSLPRSFSTSHTQNSSLMVQEPRVAELVRAASARPADTRRGPSVNLRKAKSVRTCKEDHHRKFERIDESSPLITFESDQKKLPRSKSYSVVKYTKAIKNSFM